MLSKSHNSPDHYIIIFYSQHEGELSHRGLLAKSHNSPDNYIIIFYSHHKGELLHRGPEEGQGPQGELDIPNLEEVLEPVHRFRGVSSGKKKLLPQNRGVSSRKKKLLPQNRGVRSGENGITQDRGISSRNENAHELDQDAVPENKRL